MRYKSGNVEGQQLELVEDLVSGESSPDTLGDLPTSAAAVDPLVSATCKELDG